MRLSWPIKFKSYTPSPETLALSDALDVFDDQVENVTYMLAEQMAVEYGTQLTAEQTRLLMSAKNQFRARYMPISNATFPSGFANMPSRRMQRSGVINL